MSKPANPVETTDILQDQAMQRSNTDNAPRSAIHQTLYSADTFVQYDYLAGKNLPDITRPQEGQINWLHFVGINDVALLKHALEPYGIHELVIEDILSRKQRPKIEDYGSYVFTAAQVYHYTTTGKLHSDQVYVIIGKDFVLSFQQKPLGLFSHLRRQMHENPHNILNKNTAFLAYCLLDRIVDDYFIVLESYNNRVEAIDKSLFKNENSDILSKIHRSSEMPSVCGARSYHCAMCSTNWPYAAILPFSKANRPSICAMCTTTICSLSNRLMPRVIWC